MNKAIWTKDMDEVLIKYYKRLGAAKTADRMGLSRYVVASRAKLLGLTNQSDIAYFKTADENDLRIRQVMQRIKVGDVIRGRRVVDIFPSFILVSNGKYKETFSWFELANPKAANGRQDKAS